MSSNEEPCVAARQQDRVISGRASDYKLTAVIPGIVAQLDTSGVQCLGALSSGLSPKHVVFLGQLRLQTMDAVVATVSFCSSSFCYFR